jgi:hypothetical protein
MRMPLFAALCLLACTLAGAAELTPAFTAADLDLPHCIAYDGATPRGTAPLAALEALFGLKEGPGTWEIAPPAGKERHFRVAFTRPVALGTVFTHFARKGGGARFQQGLGASISYLKATAAYPGDVTRDDDWTALPAAGFITLPVGVVTRALRFSDRFATPQSLPSRLGTTLCFTERYYNAATLGFTQETGAAFTKQTWTGSWEIPQAVAGLITSTQCTTYLHVDVLKPDTPESPALAPPNRWRRLKDHAITRNGYNLYRVEAPTPSKAIRVSVDQNNAYVFHSVLALVNLGDAANPPTQEALAPPPFQIAYPMPMDGFVALQITDKKTGTLVRRLIAEVPRDKGPVLEPWDLKDAAGQYVPPGDYTWTALARPPLALTYEGTVYNAGEPPWPAPVPGSGDWLGDHGAPITVCALGDTLFVGCSVAEGGSSLIAVDRDGHKLWGEGAHQVGFDGPERVASDGTHAYFIRGGYVQQVVPAQQYATRNVSPAGGSRDLPMSPVTGAAGRDGKLYIAYGPPPVSWLQPSFSSSEMDPRASLPIVFLKKGNGRRGGREDTNYQESEYDELMKFYAAFLTDTMPAQTPSQGGASIPSSTQACFGDAPDGKLMLAFRKPVTVGSIMLPDARVKVFALKPGVKVPSGAPDGEADPELPGGEEEGIDDDAWIPLPVTGAPGQPGVALAPPGGLRTEALRFMTTRLSFGLVMARRFADLAPRAERVYGEGTATAAGGWTVARNPKLPISPHNPARMALVWPEAVKLRGVTIVLPTALSTTAVDYWVGPAGIDPKAALADDTHWKPAGSFQPLVFAGYNAQAPTARSVDFGAVVATRAVRVRVLEPEGYRKPPYGLMPITTTHKAGFGGIVAYQPLGDDPALPVTYDQRITEYRVSPAGEPLAIVRHLPLPAPGNLAFDPAGVLHAVSEGQVVTVPLDGGKAKIVVARDTIRAPGALAFDADGLLYITDLATKDIKVCDPKTGRVVRTLGTPGGQRVGPWDPLRFDQPTGLAVDSAGKLWVTDYSWQPKRVQRMSRDGKAEKWFLGPTGYGGGGWLDPGDRSVVNYHGMKFRFDWQARTWALESLLYRAGAPESSGGASPDRPVYLNGRRYLVGPDIGAGVATICEERNGVAVPMAAAGPLDAWADVDLRPDLREKFGLLMREAYAFLWCDANGDGVPQAAETQVTERRLGAAFVGEDLSINYDGVRLRPTIGPNGVPAYDLAKLEKAPFTRPGWVTADGRMFSLSTQNTLFAADGRTPLWTYPNPYNVPGGFYTSGFGGSRPAGVLTEEHKVIGHFTLGDEEYFVTNSDPGDWFCYTKDGLLAGCLLGGPAGYGLRAWSMPEWNAGKTDLTDLRPGQEHYHGCVVKANDGKVYAVAGHHHASLVRINGLERAQRLGGTCTVTGDDIVKQQQWEVAKATRDRARQEPKVAQMPFVGAEMGIDGALDDWPDKLFVTIADHWERSLIRSEHVTDAQAALAYDDEHLYVAAWSTVSGPMKNGAREPALLFKGGAAVDVTLALDPKADPKRTTAGPGDVRLLLSQVRGEPKAVLYRPVAPGTPPEKGWRFQSPVGEVRMDLVTALPNAQVAVSETRTPTGLRWSLEAAIPWADLGYPAPRIGSRLRGDVGVLQADQNGVSTVGRLYWAGKSQTVICDIPSEARLLPSLWGELLCIEPPKEMRFGPDDVGVDL